jgi:hypothetical protein
MKKNIFLLLVIHHFCYSQVFYSEYNVASSKKITLKNFPKTELKDVGAFMELFESNDLTVVTKMEIISNERYSFIKVRLMEVIFLQVMKMKLNLICT